MLILTQDHSGGDSVAWDIVSIFSWDLGSHQYLSGDNSALKKLFKPNQLMGWVSLPILWAIYPWRQLGRKCDITQYNIAKRTQASPNMAEPLHIHTAHEKGGEYNVHVYWRAQEARCHFSLL